MSDFIVSQEDWSLHRKGHEDQQRHEEKIKEIIRENLTDFISDESIILSNGENDTVTIPIRSLNEYKIVYNHDKSQHFGQGNGDSQIGDIVGTDRSSNKRNRGSSEKGAGDMGGEDYYEKEISLKELEDIIFDELELPNLEKKQAGIMEAESYEFNDIRKIGITGNIDKKKTLMQAFKRNALKGKSSFYPVIPEDLRFKAWNETKKPDTKAIIIAMMDTSGSMGIWEKFMARSMYHWIKKFLERNYESVEIEFIAHHVEAKVVSEYEFFHKGESGGTICSSAYRKALQLIDEKYPPSQYNIYLFHASDGDNLTSDNYRCIKLMEELLEKVSMLGYIETNQYNRHSVLASGIKNSNLLRNKLFKSFTIKYKSEILYGLKHFFSKNKPIDGKDVLFNKNKYTGEVWSLKWD